LSARANKRVVRSGASTRRKAVVEPRR
jgi:hypothetical protein